MTDAPKTEAEIRADYEQSGNYFQEKYTFEEYRSHFFFERNLIDKEAEKILENTNDVAHVIDYVLSRVADVYGSYNNGCSCCRTTDLALELGYREPDEWEVDDLDDDE